MIFSEGWCGTLWKLKYWMSSNWLLRWLVRVAKISSIWSTFLSTTIWSWCCQSTWSHNKLLYKVCIINTVLLWKDTNDTKENSHKCKYQIVFMDSSFEAWDFEWDLLHWSYLYSLMYLSSSVILSWNNQSMKCTNVVESQCL